MQAPFYLVDTACSTFVTPPVYLLPIFFYNGADDYAR